MNEYLDTSPDFVRHQPAEAASEFVQPEEPARRSPSPVALIVVALVAIVAVLSAHLLVRFVP